MAEFTSETLVAICKKDGLYRTPEINEKLYLHYHGFKRIDGDVLSRYSGLKCLWLQGNGLTKLQGLDGLKALRNLCVHENVLERLEGLDSLLELRSLNASKNFIDKVENVSHLQQLETLTLGHNSIGPNTECLEEVRKLPKLQTLDLQANRLDDGESVLELISHIPTLRVVYLQGNPFVKKMRHYRKRFISTCAELRYLDDRPVFDEERRRCKAWADALASSGGQLDVANQAERDEIQKIREEKHAAEIKRIADFEAMIEVARKQKEDAVQNATVADAAAQQPHTGESSGKDFVDPDELD